jgi:hypothetical protein
MTLTGLFLRRFILCRTLTNALNNMAIGSWTSRTATNKRQSASRSQSSHHY